ncbi:MAG TPA: hypothetical protein VM889_02170 [Candidatus Thermoplasmatota archaeon]|nr:hypothetical protein [Candidatus Thermoplasmatota archaeon]
MITLDVLDWLARLDDALENRLTFAERKLARREAKSLIEDMAFRFGMFEERPLPDDIDYARALEALKDPPAAAAAFVARKPVYKARVRRKRFTRIAVLALVVVGGWAFADFATSEVATPLVNIADGGIDPMTKSNETTFVVTPDFTRVRFDANVRVFNDDGLVIVTVRDPDGLVVWTQDFSRRGTGVAHRNIQGDELKAGEWTVRYEFGDAAGHLHVEAHGVTPRR